MRARIIVGLLELVKLVVQKAFLNVVGQRHEVKRRLRCRFVVHAHVVINRFFVREMKVVLLVVCGAQGVAREVLCIWVHCGRFFVVPSQGCNTACEWFELYFRFFGRAWLLGGDRVLGKQFAFWCRNQVLCRAATLLVGDVS